jgi:hypothetical protein
LDYLEIVKFLHREEYIRNPPEFNRKLEILELLDPNRTFNEFLCDENNLKLYMTYLFVYANWVMKSIIDKEVDLYNLTNLQSKLELVRGKCPDEMSNHYVDMLYILMSSVSLYYCDKSNEALSELTKTVGSVLVRSSNWWMHDYKEEYMKSKSPEKFLSSETTCVDCCDCKGL